MKHEKFRKYGNEIPKLITKFIEKRPEFILSQEKELKIFNNNKKSIESLFNSKITIEIAEKSKNKKESSAIPSRPAIIIQ